MLVPTLHYAVEHTPALTTTPSGFSTSPPLLLLPRPLQVSTGEVKHIGPTRLYTATSASPDGRYLLVSWVS